MNDTNEKENRSACVCFYEFDWSAVTTSLVFLDVFSFEDIHVSQLKTNLPFFGLPTRENQHMKIEIEEKIDSFISLDMF